MTGAQESLKCSVVEEYTNLCYLPLRFVNIFYYLPNHVSVPRSLFRIELSGRRIGNGSRGRFIAKGTAKQIAAVRRVHACPFLLTGGIRHVHVSLSKHKPRHTELRKPPMQRFGVIECRTGASVKNT